MLGANIIIICENFKILNVFADYNGREINPQIKKGPYGEEFVAEPREDIVSILTMLENNKED